MRKIAAALLAAVPLLVAAQEAQPPAPPAQAQPAPQQAQPPAQAKQPAPQYPPQYAPPPQYTPPPPQGQYAPPPGYAPPPQGQYAPPPGYAPPPQGQYAPPPGYYPPPQGQYAPPPGSYPPPQGPYAQPGAYPPPQLAPPGPPPPPRRSPWYAAFEVGGGDGNIRLPANASQGAQTYSLHDWFGKGPTTFAFALQIGATLTPKLLLGGELTYFGATASYDVLGGTATRTLGISNLNAVLTFFPLERGLFLRGGLGLASVSSTLDSPTFGKTSDSASGGDVALGVGWAFWLGQRFNLSANLDWSRQAYGGHKVDGTSFWRLGLGFGWY